MSKVKEPEVLDRVKPSPVITYSHGYADGLKEGARRERRALYRWVYSASRASYLGEVKDWLAARSKPAKRGGKP